MERPNICGVGNKCQNVYAGHECICSDAYALSDDRKSCIGKKVTCRGIAVKLFIHAQRMRSTCSVH